MCFTTWLADAARQLRAMARYYSDDVNEINLLTHGALLCLLRQQQPTSEPVSKADLAAALCAAARALSVERRHVRRRVELSPDSCA